MDTRVTQMSESDVGAVVDSTEKTAPTVLDSDSGRHYLTFTLFTYVTGLALHRLELLKSAQFVLEYMLLISTTTSTYVTGEEIINRIDEKSQRHLLVHSTYYAFVEMNI